MNISAWLRKIGHERWAPAFRVIGIDGLQVPGTADLREHGVKFFSQRHALLSPIALPVMPKRCPDAAQLVRLPGPEPIVHHEPQTARSALVRLSVVPERHRPTPFVGREAELRHLLRASRKAAAGRGQVVLLSGEAGIGKSRILRELRPSQPHAALWHRCSPEHAFSPLHPVIGPMQEELGVADAEITDAETPRRWRSRMFDALLARIERLAQQQMVLAVYEDLQWADPSTLEYLDRLIDRIPGLPVLAIMTSRPEFEAGWDTRAHAAPLALASLAHGPCRAIVDHVSGPESLAEPIVEHIVECSAGAPLLLEELTRAALAVSDAVDPDEGADAVAMPPLTLSEGLIARLGSGTEASAIAQVGAVIGSAFSCEMLAAVVDRPQDQLRAALDHLVASGVVLRCGPDGSYAFRHALIRDAAYQSIAEPLRRTLHPRVAQLLAAGAPDATANAPEILAQHYAAAGLAEPAAALWLCAGKRAGERHAQAEAIAMFGKGLDLLDGLAAGAQAAAPRAELLAALARALTVTKGLAAPEVAQACDLARTLCQCAGQSAQQNPALFPAMRGLWEHYNTRGDLEAACELAEQCRMLAAGAQAPDLIAEADFCLGVSSLFAGRLAEARQRLNRSTVSFDARCRRDSPASEGRDPRIIALVHLAQALWLCGYPDQAVRASLEAVAAARAAGHPFSLTYALLGASWVFQLRGDNAATRALAQDAMVCATEEDFPAFLAMATIVRDWTTVGAEVGAEAGDRAGAAAAIRTALVDYRAAGAEIARPYLLGLLAGVHGALAEAGPALDALDEAVDAAAATGEHWYEPELRRQEGELLLRQSITNRRVASARFCQSIALAQQQGSRSLELRAAVSLARLWADIGRRSQACGLLAPICGWFKEGFETADLKDASALLDQLQ